MIECKEMQDTSPVCPHCEAELDTVGFRALGGAVGKRYVYFCPKCRRVLGVSHRKGFWMG